MSRTVSPERVLSRLELLGTRLGLDTSRRLLTAMGSPHLELPAVLVAGTNGKGSVAALLASIGSAAGYRTGLFTSPHLESVCERLKIDGSSIRAEKLGQLLERVSSRSKLETGAQATYFEALFIAACCWFAEEEVDLVVFEVGLGGRLDATNVSEPLLSVITEIGLEHRTQLGDSIDKIAIEKAGIMRPGRPVVVGARNAIAVKSLIASAGDIGARWLLAPEVVRIAARSEDEDWSQRLRVRSEKSEYNAHLRLAGKHQEENLVTAVAAVERLRDLGWRRLDRAAIERGISSCYWPGRLERIEVPGGTRVVLDAAHNPNAAQRLADFLADRLQNYCLLFGVLDDKDVEEMLPVLTAAAQSVVLTRPDSTRSRDPSELARWSACPDTRFISNVTEGLDRALESGLPLVVCGSIYLVGAVRQELRRRFGAPRAF